MCVCTQYDGEFNEIINHIMFIQRDSPQITFLGIMWDKTTCACKRKWCLHIIITKVSFCLSWYYTISLLLSLPCFDRWRDKSDSDCAMPCHQPVTSLALVTPSNLGQLSARQCIKVFYPLDSFRNCHSPWISQKEYPTSSNVHTKCLDQSVILKMPRMEISMGTKQSELNLLVFPAPPVFSSTKN